MSTLNSDSSPGSSTPNHAFLDTVAVVFALVVLALLGLWLFHAVVGFILFIFKIAILVLVIMIIVRLVHRFSRKST